MNDEQRKQWNQFLLVCKMAVNDIEFASDECTLPADVFLAVDARLTELEAAKVDAETLAGLVLIHMRYNPPQGVDLAYPNPTRIAIEKLAGKLAPPPVADPPKVASDPKSIIAVHGGAFVDGKFVPDAPTAKGVHPITFDDNAQAHFEPVDGDKIDE